MIQRSVTQTARPASGAMNLDTGAIDPKQAFLAGGFALASLVVMALGGLIFVWSMPDDSPYATVGAYRVIGMLTGGLIAFLGFGFAWSIGRITIASWKDHRARLMDWHNAELDMYLAQNGVETITEVSQLELTPQVAGHVLLTAMAIHHRLGLQDRFNNAPWSVRGLEEKLYLAGSNNSVLLGEITGTRPELMSARLAQLGLVKDRQPGAAGVWVPQSYDQIFELVAKNWSKIR